MAEKKIAELEIGYTKVKDMLEEGRLTQLGRVPPF